MTILSEFFTSLRNTYIEWNDILVNPNFCRNAHEITWGSHASQMMPVNSNLLDVIKLIENQQYSFQIQSDESIIQIYYKFDDSDSIIAANLAYYGTTFWGESASIDVSERDEEDDEETTESDQGRGPINSESVEEVADDIVESNENQALIEPKSQYINWLRIDFDCNCEKPSVIHHFAHMHLAGIPNGRIPFDTVPSPFQFVEFVIANFYPEQYKKIRMHDTGILKEPVRIKEMSRHHIEINGIYVLPYVIHLSGPKSDLPLKIQAKNSR